MMSMIAVPSPPKRLGVRHLSWREPRVCAELGSARAAGARNPGASRRHWVARKYWRRIARRLRSEGQLRGDGREGVASYRQTDSSGGGLGSQWAEGRDHDRPSRDAAPANSVLRH